MANNSVQNEPVERLFACLAEQVKLPFIQVMQASELMGTGIVNARHSQQTIQEVSQAALQLIDGFLLQVRLQQDAQLQLESVSISSILYDTAELLDPYAKLHGMEIRLDIAGKYGPVMAHATGLRAALANIGYSLIDAAEKDKLHAITLGVQKTMKGVTTGVYTNSGLLTTQLLEQARSLHGAVHQPMSEFSSSNVAGIFVADGLIRNLGATLRVARLKGASGLATTFVPSRQLSLV